MKNLATLILLLISFSAFSQDPFLQNSNPQAKKKAVEITNKYIPELGLTGEQQLLFQQKVEEYVLRRNKLKAEFSEKEKLNLLYQLQEEETADMQDILTRPQLEVYKQVKPKFQPLEKVEKD
ncbi:hypothetical protein [Aequorivita marina]|uniref:hypothetical protein n=1 Tax=Aequorivita marina TaxID=3073654 RepID=UPI0028744E36|nr:hypothetical protein [Aequorivita sp. S2608]MDS1297689.1 hypothetical protein [Aequorivita sp. S2608]